jgi:hypothetical protein
MMNSTKEAEEILETLLERLGECQSSIDTDEYLELAINIFTATDREKITHKEFNRILTSVYQHIILRELKTECTPDEALREIAWILEYRYRGNETQGYDDALFDAASEGGDGLLRVLGRVLGIIAQMTRTKLSNFQLYSSLDPLDWHLKVRVTEVILERYAHLIPPPLVKSQPAQLVPHLGDLIARLC